MPIRSHPVRPVLNAATLSPRMRPPPPRPWPALASPAQTRLAQHLARLVQRLRSAREAPHADTAG